MSPRDWTLFIADMQEACDKIADYTRGIDFSAFCADTRTVLMLLSAIFKSSVRPPKAYQMIRNYTGLKSTGARLRDFGIALCMNTLASASR